jgi:hypothetical protein
MSQQKPPLDYQAYFRAKDRRRCVAVAVSCFVGGVVFAPIAILLAVASGGAGHGNYGFARLLFPYPMLLTLMAGGTITAPLIVLAWAQFPVYGAATGVAALKGMKTFRVVAAAIGIVHLIAVIACFSGAITNFS